VKGHVSSDHVHLLLSVLLHLSVFKLMESMKVRSSRKLQLEYRYLNPNDALEIKILGLALQIKIRVAFHDITF